MDTLYTGDIPQDYKYARFSNGYIDLYNTQNIDGALDYYRIYLYDNLFLYEHKQGVFNSQNTFAVTEVQTTNDFHYRRDIADICFLGVVEICVILILFNLVSSVFKKGGILSGLL